MPNPTLPGRARLSRAIRRRRRPLAAVLAGLGVLLALASLRQPAPIATEPTTDTPMSARLAATEVAVPIVLSSPALSVALSVGDIVDVVGTGADGVAETIAHGARVLQIPEGSSGFGGTGSSVVLLATDEADGVAVSVAAAAGSLSFLIRQQAGAGGQ